MKNPPFWYLSVLVNGFLFFLFLFWLFPFCFWKKKECCPPKKGASMPILQCPPLFLLCFFSPFHSLFFCFSLSLYVSLIIFFLPCLLSFFLSLVLLCFCLIFYLPCVFGFFLEKNGFLSCFVFQIPFLIYVFVSYLKLCFCSTSKVLLFFFLRKLRKTHFWWSWGLQQDICLLITCVVKNVKSDLFLAQFWANFGWYSKSNVK